MGAEQLINFGKSKPSAWSRDDLKRKLRRYLRDRPGLTEDALRGHARTFPIRTDFSEPPPFDVHDLCLDVMLESQAQALLNAPDVATAMGILEKLNGHFTLLKFTTGWKAVFETPWLEPDEDDKDCDYEKMLRLPMADTPLAAIRLAAAKVLSE